MAPHSSVLAWRIPGIISRSPIQQADSLPAESQGNKPRNEEMLSLPLLLGQEEQPRNMLAYFVMCLVTYGIY